MTMMMTMTMTMMMIGVMMMGVMVMVMVMVICLARKEGFFGPKIGEKLKCKGKKLSNFRKKKKKKKRRLFGPKRNKLGLSLKRKKGVFRNKKLGKIWVRWTKKEQFKKKKKIQLTDCKENRTFRAKKNKVGLSLRTKKKVFFWAKIFKNLGFKGQKLAN